MFNWTKITNRYRMKTKKFTSALILLLILPILFSIHVNALNDTLAPSIVYLSPSGYMNSGEVVLQAITNEDSTCRYDISNIDYDSMGSTLIGNSTNHEESMSLNNGNYEFYVLCKDYSNNTMSAASKASFTIDTINPVIASKAPSGISNSDYTTLTIVTTEKTICKFDTVNKSYESLTYTFTKTNSTSHEQELFDLNTGEIKYYIGCKDYSGNRVYSSIFFEVNLPATFDIDIENKPPLKEGTYKIEVYSSKRLLNPPTLKYKFDDEAREYDSSLIGENNNWEGYIIIPEFPKDRVGKFIISGKDYDGLTGTKINSGQLFLVDTVNPIEPDSLNIETANNKIEITWNYDGEKADHYIIYRSLSSGVEPVDYYDTSDSEKYIDTDVDSGEEYYYKVAAVDEAGNKGTLSKEIKIIAIGKVAQTNTAIVEIKKLSSALETELNYTINIFKASLIDFDLSIKKIERMNKNEEIVAIDSFKLLSDARNTKSDIEDIINNLDSLRKIDMNKNDFDSRIKNAKDSLEDIKSKAFKNLEIINSVSFQQVSSEKEIVESREEALLRFNLNKEEQENFTQMSEKLNLDSTVYTEIVSAKVTYFDGSTKSRTIFSKSVKSKVDEKNVWVIETIPKEVALDANEIVFDKKPRVLKNDPIVAWEYTDFKTNEINYYVDKLVNLDDANLVRTHLAYNPEKFIKVEEVDADTKITANAISKINFLKGINFKELFIPLIGVILIASLLVYYFVYLKEDDEHNIIIKEEIGKNNDVSNSIMPQKQILKNSSDNLDINNYNYMLNLVKHANDHADNMNIPTAKKEYKLLYELFKKVNFENEHAKKDVIANVRQVYNKILLFENVNQVLTKAHSMNVQELTNVSNSINMLMNIINKDRKTQLIDYANDYYNYLENIRGINNAE